MYCVSTTKSVGTKTWHLTQNGYDINNEIIFIRNSRLIQVRNIPFCVLHFIVTEQSTMMSLDVQ